MLDKLLALSLLGNAALLAAWLTVGSEPVEARLPRPVGEQRAPAAAAGNVARWRELGLDEIEVQRLALATLEAQEIGALANPWETYWRAGDPALAYAKNLREGYARIRIDLEQAFGPRAATSAEFARAFRPLAAEAGFLSSGEQLELQRRRLEARSQQIFRGGGDAGATLPATAPVALDFLQPAAAFEVNLRISPRATQLRASGIDFEEHEFRAAFELLESVDASRDPSTHAALRPKVNALLGVTRGTALLATRDPLWPMTRRIAAEYGRAEAQAEAAYNALSEAQQELLNLAATRADGERFATAVAAIAETERARLIAALGDRATDALLLARDGLRGTLPNVAQGASSFE